MGAIPAKRDSELDVNPALVKLLPNEILTRHSQDLKAEAVAGTKEGAQAGEECTEQWHHGLGFIAYEFIPAPVLLISA